MVSFFRSVSGSALGHRCAGWQVRPSSRSVSGFVLVARFVGLAQAQRFALRQSAGLPARCKGCAVRFGGGFWSVSVPVAVVRG